jgi:hypothetical protein
MQIVTGRSCIEVTTTGAVFAYIKGQQVTLLDVAAYFSKSYSVFDVTTHMRLYLFPMSGKNLLYKMD